MNLDLLWMFRMRRNVDTRVFLLFASGRDGSRALAPSSAKKRLSWTNAQLSHVAVILEFLHKCDQELRADAQGSSPSQSRIAIRPSTIIQ